MALWIIPNIEYFSMMGSPAATAPAPRSRRRDVVERDYGNRVGVFRLMETLDRYDIRGTVALNSNLCAEHPRIMEKARSASGNGWATTRATRGGSTRPVRAKRRRSSATPSRPSKSTPASGRKGWLSAGLQETWDTLDHLMDNGCGNMSPTGAMTTSPTR